MEDQHRQFLQAFMSRGILNWSEVRDLHENVCRRYGVAINPSDQTALARFVNLINQSIRQLNMEIKKALSEENGSSHYVLVNTVNSSILKLANQHTPQEYEFFKKLVDLIVEAEPGHVSSIDALNLVSGVKRMQKQEAEELMERLNYSKYLHTVDGRVSLGTRALVELESYIRHTFPNLVVNCEVCKKICLQGQACTDCDIKIHAHCARKLFGEQDNPRCPSRQCGAIWVHDLTRRRKGEENKENGGPVPHKRKR